MMSLNFGIRVLLLSPDSMWNESKCVPVGTMILDREKEINMIQFQVCFIIHFAVIHPQCFVPLHQSDTLA